MPPRNKPTTPKSSDKPTGAKRERKQYAEVSLTDLNPVKVTKEEKATVLPGRERSEAQKAVDKTVRENVYDNIKAGLPKDFRDMEVVKYTLPTQQAETIKFMIGKACNLLNCKPKFGRPAWDDGKEVVTFAAIPRDPAQWTDKPETAEVSGGNPDGKASEDAKRTDPSEFETPDA